MAQENGKKYMRLVGLFILISALLSILNVRLEAYKINWVVAEGANLIIFVFTYLNIYFQQKNMNNPNPSAVIRGVMAGTFLKLFGLAGSAMVYLLAAGDHRSVNAVFVGMGIYIFYTWIEVKILLQLKPKQ